MKPTLLLAAILTWSIWLSKPSDSDPSKRGTPWQVKADSVEWRTNEGLYTVFVSDGRLRVHAQDAQELIPHWVAANVIELEGKK